MSTDENWTHPEAAFNSGRALSDARPMLGAWLHQTAFSTKLTARWPPCYRGHFVILSYLQGNTQNTIEHTRANGTHGMMDTQKPNS